MLNTTIGKLVVEDALPEDMKDWAQLSFNKKTLGAFMADLAQRHPDEYRDVTHKLLQIARQGALESGSNSFGLKHIKVSPAAKTRRAKLLKEVHAINDDDSLSDTQRNNKLIKTIAKAKEGFEPELMEEAKAENSPLERMISSGARGNPGSLASLRGGDFQYVDSEGQALPVPITKSYGEGLDPVSYWAGSFGARQGLLSAKFCLFEDTKVLMADYSEKAIKDIKPGEYIIGADRAGRLEPTRVNKVFNNGRRECQKYLFRIGSTNRMVELLATEDHKILGQIRDRTYGKYDFSAMKYDTELLPLGRFSIRKKAKKNIFIAYPPQGEADCGGIREDRAILAGLMTGDGCMSPSCHGSYTLSCADPVLISGLVDYLEPYNLQLNKASGGNYNYTLSEIVKSPRIKEVTRKYKPFAKGILNPTKAWLRYTLGDKLAHEKVLPDSIWSWDLKSAANFVAGLYSADGTIACTNRKNGKSGCTVSVGYCSTSAELIYQVRRLLELRFGIWGSSINVREACKTKTAKHDLYTFHISHADAVRKFHQSIPLIGIKKSQLDEAVSGLVAVPRNSEIGFKIFSKEIAGELNTYDLEVDNKDHLFVLANGLIVSNSTAESGFFAKRLQQASHRLLVTGVDEDHERDGEIRGMPTNSDDPHNEGSLLAHPVGGYAKNTILTPKILQDLKRKGVGRILVRSPIVGGAKDGGLLARDVGIRESGDLPHPGSLVGLLAAQSIAERLSQQALGAKHLGGIAGKGVEQLTQGFPLVEQLVDIPKAFKGGATHAQTDGVVQLIHEAPAGGMYVTVNDQDHYIPVGHAVSVKRGDHIEAGDMLSSGIPNPSEIVKHKGIGEGRRYFTHQLAGVLQQAGVNAHRRNVELVARAMIDHVKMNDEFSDWLPGDVVSYQTLERNWHPREGFKQLEPKAAVGQYLEKPILHYTVGTKIQPSMIKDMDEFGIKNLTVHENPPPFEPLMVRSEDSLQHDPDWVSQMYGSGLKKNLLKSVHRGATSDEKGTSFVPSLAKGVNFGLLDPFDKLNKKMGEEKQAFGLGTIPKAIWNYGGKQTLESMAQTGVYGVSNSYLPNTQPGWNGAPDDPDVPSTPGDYSNWAANRLFREGLGPGSSSNVYDEGYRNDLSAGAAILASPLCLPGETAVNLATDFIVNPTISEVKQRSYNKQLAGLQEVPMGPSAARLYPNSKDLRPGDENSTLAVLQREPEGIRSFHAAEILNDKYMQQHRQHWDSSPWGSLWDSKHSPAGGGISLRDHATHKIRPALVEYSKTKDLPALEKNLREIHTGLASEWNNTNFNPDVITDQDRSKLLEYSGVNEADRRQKQMAIQQNFAPHSTEKLQMQQAAALDPQRASEISRRQEAEARRTGEVVSQQKADIAALRAQNPADPYAQGQQYAAQLAMEHLPDSRAIESQGNQQFIAQHPAPKLNAEEQAALAKARGDVTPEMMAQYGPRQNLASMQIEDLRREAGGLPRNARSLGEIAGASVHEQPLASRMTSLGEIPSNQYVTETPDSNTGQALSNQITSIKGGPAVAPKSLPQSNVASKPATPPQMQPPKIPTPPKMTTSSPTGKLPLVPGGKS